MAEYEVFKERYKRLYRIETVQEEVLSDIEGVLNLRLPEDFKRIASFYRGGFLGGKSHYDISMPGPASNIVAETLRLRNGIDLPLNFVAIAEPPESLIVMDVISSKVIWCDAFDVHNLSDLERLHNPKVWPSYSAFFEYLLDEEESEREE